MDINFPLILVLLVFVTGGIWLIDLLFLAPKRRRAAERLLAEARQSDEPIDSLREGELARDTLLKEPSWVEYSKSFFPVLFVVLVLRSFLVEPFQIPSASMVPTLEVGDFILVNKFTYGIRLPVLRTKVIDVNEPQRGDVMVFFPPHKDIYFIKRVVGLPGDEIRYVDNVLYVNGVEQPQEFITAIPPIRPQYQVVTETLAGKPHMMQKASLPGLLSRSGHWVVPEGHYFMMGDNRDNSSDSRVWGPVPAENIVGKAFAVWMHWESLFSLPSFSRVGAID